MTDMCSTIEEKLRLGKINLPSLPETVIQLRKIASNPNSTIKELSEFICQDAGLSAQLIRIAQTMRYSHPGYSISSLNTAINRIGMFGTINLVMAMSILQGYLFHSKNLYEMCKKDSEYAKQVSRYAITIYELLYGNMSQEQGDFISLAAVFLNIGALPIYSELDSIESITKIQLNKDFIFKLKNDLGVSLGKKILEKWCFNKRFIEILDLTITDSYTDDMKAVVYACKFLSTATEDKIAPLSDNIADCFCSIKEGSFRNTLIEFLKEKLLIKE